MPVVQFGTYKMKGEASVYDCEKEVGRAVLESVVDRKNLFIQTELWRSFVGPAKNGKPKFYSELRKFFKRLGVYD